MRKCPAQAQNSQLKMKPTERDATNMGRDCFRFIFKLFFLILKGLLIISVFR